MDTIKKVEYKNQHYIPKSYFKLFSDDGKTILIYDKEKKEFYKNASIKDQGSEDYFYGKNTEFEKSVSKLEDEIILILRKLNSNGFQLITTEDYRTILTYLCFQYKRTRHDKDLTNQLSSKLHRQLIRETRSKIDTGNVLTDEIIERIKVDDPHLFIYSMARSLYSGVLLSDLQRCILVNKTNRRFVFSDSPAVLHNSYFCNNKNTGVGFQSPGLQLLFPISNEKVLLLYDKEYYSINPENETINVTNKKDVSLINLLQMLYCSKLVFFSKNSEINRLQKLRKDYDKLFVRPKINETKYKFNNREGINEFIKLFNTLYNFKLNLSFIKEKTLIKKEEFFRNKDICDFYEKVVMENLDGKFSPPKDSYEVKVVPKTK
ncbi:MAG: DUF4238 domain-containing protein [Candidatus Kapaibacterium sp.]